MNSNSQIPDTTVIQSHANNCTKYASADDTKANVNHA